MAITRIADTIYAFRFLKLLVTPWDKTSAYEKGILDDNGKVIKKPVTAEEKEVYTIFHRLVYNVKRLLNKLPLGQTKLASYAAALYLIKEETGLTEQQLEQVIDKLGIEFDRTADITESWIMNGDYIHQGDYILKQDIANPVSGELIHLKGSKVRVDEQSDPVDNLFSFNIYEVTHLPTNQKIYITAEDITR